MGDKYYPPRIDTFLAKTEIKPRDYRPYRTTQEQKEKRRRNLIEAAKKNIPFSELE